MIAQSRTTQPEITVLAITESMAALSTITQPTNERIAQFTSEDTSNVAKANIAYTRRLPRETLRAPSEEISVHLKEPSGGQNHLQS